MAYATLESILGKDQSELTALKQDEFTTEKLGTLPYTAVDHKEYKVAKRGCMKMIKDGTGSMVPDLDDDQLMLEIIVAAVDKDGRSDFTFANELLLKKLNVVTATAAVSQLLSPGEIFNLAIEIQGLSGFGAKAAKDLKDDVKNS
ncbi:MAG: hypothetical protein NHB14_20725 [Desulfosporosinus sp.]|nr:hypothetical protein [Desulfosporosinus sp.]